MEKTLGAIKQGVRLAAIGLSASLRMRISQSASEKYLLKSLSGIPGLPQKAAQWLNLKFDEVSEIQLDRMRVEDVHALIVERAPKLAEQIREIQKNGKSASLGQVNQVLLLNGRQVAVKLQYPEIENLFKDQLSMMGFALRKSPAVKFGLDIEEYQTDFLGKIEEELNYELEAQKQQKFYSAYLDEIDIAIPKVYSEFSSKTVLSQEWITSDQLPKLKSLDKSIKFKLGKILVRHLLVSIFKKGVVHTDFQPENWGYDSRTGRLVLYDFGSCLELTPEDRNALVELVKAARDRDSRRVFDSLLTIGFKENNLLQVADKVPYIIEKLFEPLIENRPWRTKEWELSNSLNSSLGDLGWWFRAAGPPWFLFLMKAVQGYIYALGELDVAVPSYQIFNQVLSETSFPLEETLMKPEYAEFHKKVESQCKEYPNCAQFLKVLVRENGKDKVSLTMPRRSVDDMESLIEESVLSVLEAKGISIAECIQRVQKTGYQPQLIFEENVSDQKYYRVWLD